MTTYITQSLSEVIEDCLTLGYNADDINTIAERLEDAMLQEPHNEQPEIQLTEKQKRIFIDDIEALRR